MNLAVHEYLRNLHLQSILQLQNPQRTTRVHKESLLEE
jgi:hypothetical protein